VFSNRVLYTRIIEKSPWLFACNNIGKSLVFLKGKSMLAVPFLIFLLFAIFLYLQFLAIVIVKCC